MGGQEHSPRPVKLNYPIVRLFFASFPSLFLPFARFFSRSSPANLRLPSSLRVDGSRSAGQA